MPFPAFLLRAECGRVRGGASAHASDVEVGGRGLYDRPSGPALRWRGVMGNGRQLTGNAGVYHVARELSRHGWNVMLTVRNARGADIYAISQCETIAHPIQVKAHSGKPNDVRLGLAPETLITPWWVFVAYANSAGPICYLVPLDEIRERMTRDPGSRSGKSESERAFWFDRRFYTPGSDRELVDAQEAWFRLGDPGR